jgi:hypothetical protein
MSLEESFRALAADEAATRVPPRVDASVMAAWDAHSRAGVGRARAAQDRPGWLWCAGIVAASLAALAIVVGWPAANQPREAVRGSAPVSPVAPGPAEPVARSALTGSVAQPPSGQRVVLRSVPRPQAEAEAQAAYVLVPDAEAGAPPLTLMRVRMPRSAFSRLGVPIANPDGEGMVDVEVLVGEDGVATSIRRAAAVGWVE